MIVDEIHECLVSEKAQLELDWHEKNRRASRELLGIAQKDVTKRPLVYRKSIFGLTGTPLLDNSDRVIIGPVDRDLVQSDHIRDRRLAAPKLVGRVCNSMAALPS